MQFRDFIYHVLPLLQNSGFEVTATMQNYVSFQSAVAVIAVSYDPRIREYYVHAGNSESGLYELNALNLKHVFNFDTGELGPAEYFLKFFQQENNPLLEGDVQSFEALKRFELQRSHEMNQRMDRDQHLEMAEAAWKRKDYRNVIDSLSKLDVSELQESVKRKYRIALQKSTRPNL